ncbi:MAG: transglutaminase domain-containing protein [Phycisphaerales bacterium]|nr:MAG: transglutaminase domain-containing protein [Phycisphaerales bacterium]
MHLIGRVNRLRRPVRWGVKGLFLLVVLVGITYPRPGLLVRAYRHLTNMNGLVNPDEPAMQAWREELESRLGAEPPADQEDLLARVQSFVIEKVPYDWDWNTWGVMEYTPTVAEVVQMGREDCDGRAVVAASLLRGLGYEARLVGNPLHIWVWTEHGELMGPAGAKTFEPTATGYRFNWASVRGWTSHLSFGMAVFPLGRELVMVAAIWLCGLSLAARRWTWLASLVLLTLGLVVIRLAARDPGQAIRWGLWLGWCQVAVGVLLLWFGPRIHRRPAGPEPG